MYGIEIELEAVPRTVYERALSYWQVVGDGSLRNRGAEFVSSFPVPYDQVGEALNELHETIVRFRSAPDPSDRCGTHIHMNARDISSDTVSNLLRNYLWIESSLFAEFPERAASNFCVPHNQQIALTPRIIHAFEEGNLEMLLTLGRKYSALNVAPMTRQGSLEWRQFPAVLPVTEVKKWVDMVEELKQMSRVGVMERNQAEDFCHKHFTNVEEDMLDLSEELLSLVDMGEERLYDGFGPFYIDPDVLQHTTEDSQPDDHHDEVRRLRERETEDSEHQQFTTEFMDELMAVAPATATQRPVRAEHFNIDNNIIEDNTEEGM